MRPREAFRLALLLLAAGLGSRGLAAGQDHWEAEVRTDISAVSINATDTTWWGNRVDVRYGDLHHDLYYLSGDVEHRGSDTNGNVLAGAYLRRGNWFYFGEARGGPDTTFLPRFGIEGQAAYLVHHTLFAADYRFIDFQSTNVHLGALSATQSFAWGEAELRLVLGWNVSEDAPIRAGIFRALWFVAPGWRVGGGAAYGTRIFDVIAVETASKQGWTAYASASREIGSGQLRLDFAYSREGDGFRQVGGALSYRRSF